MEELKELKELTKADPRQRRFAVPAGKSGRSRRRTLRDLYTEVESAKLSARVPEKIRTHFATAQNLAVYSWYVYSFNVTAQLMAYVTLEWALRDRLTDSNDRPFKKLLEQARKEGLIRPDELPHVSRTGDHVPYLGVDWAATSPSEYAERLSDGISRFRNEAAHGTANLHPHGYLAVMMCAQLINQLYEPQHGQ